MPSWAACIPQFGKDWLDLLGRWRSGQALDYVRTSQRRVEVMQKTVAELIRNGAAVEETLDEASLIEDLGSSLSFLGHAENIVAEQLERLKFDQEVAGTEAATEVATEDSVEEDDPFEEGPAVVEGVMAGVAVAETPIAGPAEGAEPAAAPGAASLVDVKHHVMSVEAPATIPDKSYVVSVSARGFRRLHRVGDCYFEPGRGYMNFKVLGPLRQQSASYNA